MTNFGKVRISSLMFYVTLICVFSYSLLEDVGISISAIDSYKRPILLLGAVCLCYNYKFLLRAIKKKPHKIVAIMLVVFSGMIIYSSFLNKGTVERYNTISNTLNLVLFLVELFLVMIFASEKDKVKPVFKVLYWYVLILIIITDSLLFLGISYTDGVFKTYMIGTKFSISYLHIQFLALFLVKQRSKIRFKPFYIVLMMIFAAVVLSISIKVDCTTGMIGCIMLTILMILFNTFPRGCLENFSKVYLFIICIVGSVMFAFGIEQILSNSLVQYYITNALGRDLTLTGRSKIFNLFAIKMVGHWPWGYGYGNAYPMSILLFRFADAQNAMLQWILQIGILPCIVMALIYCVIMYQVSKKENKIEIMPMLALVYVFIFLGTIEITYNLNFWLWMFLLFMWGNSQPKEEKYKLFSS